MGYLYKKLLKLGEKWDKGLVKRTVDNILNDPQAGWTFLTTVLLLGGFGILCCFLWFYFLIKQGMPWYWIVFDSAVVLFCLWAIIWGIIPMTKDCYRQINDKMSGDKMTE